MEPKIRTKAQSTIFGLADKNLQLDFIRAKREFILLDKFLNIEMNSR
jgi:hypothetical protein